MQKGKENLAMGAASSYEENTRRKKAFGRSRDVLSFLRETPKTMIFLPYKYPFSFFDDSDACNYSTSIYDYHDFVNFLNFDGVNLILTNF